MRSSKKTSLLKFALWSLLAFSVAFCKEANEASSKLQDLAEQKSLNSFEAIDLEITGDITNEQGVPLMNAEISATVEGNTFQTQSDGDGSFTLSLSGVSANTSQIQVQIKKDDFQNASRVAELTGSDLLVLDLITLKINSASEDSPSSVKTFPTDVKDIKDPDFHNVEQPTSPDNPNNGDLDNDNANQTEDNSLTDNNEETEDNNTIVDNDEQTENNNTVEEVPEPVEVTVSGQVLNDFDKSPLAGATVLIRDSSDQTIQSVTNSMGKFELISTQFALDSSYVIEIAKENYRTRNDISITINGLNNVLEEGPTRLFKSFGPISGVVKAVTTGQPLPGVKVSATDSKGNSITANSDAMGEFKLESNFFLFTNQYVVKFSRSNYQSAEATVSILNALDNSVGVTGVTLTEIVSVSGTVRDGQSLQGIQGAKVELIAFENTGSKVIGSLISSAQGSYSFSGELIKAGQTYVISCAKEGYFALQENGQPYQAVGPFNAGMNNLEDFKLQPVPPPINEISGTVRNYLSQQTLSGVKVRVLDENGMQESSTDSLGKFALEGDFVAGKDYSLTLERSGFTGSVNSINQVVSFRHTGNGMVNLNQDSSIQSKLFLYPIGIFLPGNGNKTFAADIKQTWEKFLEGKPGPTIGARTAELQRKGKNGADQSSFYLHIDYNKSGLQQAVLPNEAKWTNFIAINGNPQSGVLAEGIGEDDRAIPWAVKNFVLYQFLVTTNGDYIIETSGNTDTAIELYNASGSKVANDNNSGSGKNAKISKSLMGGYYVAKVMQGTASAFGQFDLTLKGPENQNAPLESMPERLTTDDGVIISHYDQSNHKLFIAGKGEAGSSGTIELEAFQGVGGVIRGRFWGTLRIVSSTGASMTIPSSNPGYFNIVREQ
jgi:phosphatidate phosphatase APP1